MFIKLKINNLYLFKVFEMLIFLFKIYDGLTEIMFIQIDISYIFTFFYLFLF